MQSRQDYMIAVKEKRIDTDSKGDDPGGAARRTEICGVTWRGISIWQHVSNERRVLRSYEERCFGSAAWREVR